MGIGIPVPLGKSDQTTPARTSARGWRPRAQHPPRPAGSDLRLRPALRALELSASGVGASPLPSGGHLQYCMEGLWTQRFEGWKDGPFGTWECAGRWFFFSRRQHLTSPLGWQGRTIAERCEDASRKLTRWGNGYWTKLTSIFPLHRDGTPSLRYTACLWPGHEYDWWRMSKSLIYLGFSFPICRMVCERRQ